MFEKDTSLFKNETIFHQAPFILSSLIFNSRLSIDFAREKL